jgi:hypothetical protein
VSEGFEFGDEAAGFAFGVQAAVEVVGAEFLVGGAGGQDVPDDDEDGVATVMMALFFPQVLR